jgi:hypothetical protein
MAAAASIVTKQIRIAISAANRAGAAASVMRDRYRTEMLS